MAFIVRLNLANGTHFEIPAGLTSFIAAKSGHESANDDFRTAQTTQSETISLSSPRVRLPETKYYNDPAPPCVSAIASTGRTLGADDTG